MLTGLSTLETAERRWRDTTTRHPDLGPAVAVQRRVVTRALDIARYVDTDTPFRVHIQPEACLAKLGVRLPILIGEAIDVDGTHLGPFAVGFCDDLATGSSGHPAHRLRRVFDDGRLDVGSLISSSLARRQEAIRTKAHQLGISPDLLWLVAELVAGPLAHRLQNALLVAATGSAERVSDWNEGYCPVCGSRPAFAERIGQVSDTRRLRCSFCGCGWDVAAGQCIYCGAVDDALLTAAPDPVVDGHCIEMCRDCGGYLKNLRVTAPTPFPLLAVEDLASADLDAGAAERGYGRPPMPQFQPTDATSPCLGTSDEGGAR